MGDKAVQLPEGWTIEVDTSGASPIRFVKKSDKDDVPVFQLSNTAYLGEYLFRLP